MVREINTEKTSDGTDILSQIRMNLDLEHVATECSGQVRDVRAYRGAARVTRTAHRHHTLPTVTASRLNVRDYIVRTGKSQHFPESSARK